MKKILLTVVFVCIGIVGMGKLGGFVYGEEKNPKPRPNPEPRVKQRLCIEIIEENWDSLEFWPPKRDSISVYQSPTKQQVMERKLKEMRGVDTKSYMLKNIKKHSLPSDAKLIIHHLINYFGRIEKFKDNDIFDKDKYRFGEIDFNYFYKQVPEKISLLTDPTDDPMIWSFSRHYKYIRLVKDININFIDKMGNMKIQYGGTKYNLEVGQRLELPIEEANFTIEEMENFKEYYEYKWGFNVRKYYWEGALASSQQIFQFKTKVTIINHGYIEVEL